ncbi:protein-tyrosine phosphatase [Enterococcus sp. DIV0212c]|uniref:tyrosine-protein phosphatase n=1 Tax=Enterococcus sp. DIV0212c TaxID=2230867 RepID=UPI001A9BE09B|nr:tyrosine-protein phosphatase [Enterococcus sp. DIV0212c]MBO1353099.1 tyrosine-protein phosphatase [Enterococcus sp. DIV0212c]
MVTITNFRDIGGIKNKDGKQIKKDVFLRSGELSNLTKEDERRLETTYRLGKIIDLRSEAEVEERPDMSVPKAEYIHIDILEDIQDEGASIGDFVKIGSPEKSASYMEKLYEDIALNGTSQKGYNKFFKEILALPKQESILFHCFAGKDRTGIAALLVLETLNVSREAIYTDYLLTNNLRKKENAMILEQAKKADLEEANLEALHVALNVDSSYLDNFYQTVEKQYGDMSTYLKQAIGIDKGTKEALNHRFVLD